LSTHTKTVPARARLIRLVHVGKSKLGLDRSAYEAMLEGATGKRSSSDMTEAELRLVLKGMRAAGFSGKRMPARPGEAPLCSPEKLYYIKGLWELVSRTKTEDSLNRFVKRIAHVDNVRFLDDHAATRVILALRDMARKAGYEPDGLNRRGTA
jgi:hypothetical protein